jgi:carbon storage regulator
MLVVTRKVNESLMIGEDIKIIVLESRDGNVKLGIEAPRNIKVFRKEIYEEIKKQNSEALDISADTMRRMLEK